MTTRRATLLSCLLGLVLPAAASAGDLKLCTVDAQTALNETEEGKAAQKRLESMYASKQADLDKMQKDLERELQDYDQRKMILADSARQEQERKLLEKRQTFQNTVMQAEQEMQQTYNTLLSDMEDKLMGVASAVGKEKGCTVLFPKEATIYVSSDVVDVTSDVIKKLDAK
ncbi:MAG: OmpH family outer membrane protein [Alphaproteobacteria bacterium]|nr:OmpH family outer membrane protein [Alphaproteobacteria bacterium]